jgi:uncharacterized membrane protein
MHSSANIFMRLLRFLWVLFLNGFLTILPITITLALFKISFKLIINWLQPIKNCVAPHIPIHIPYVEFVVAVIVIFIIGTIMRIFILRSLIHALEDLVGKMPLIRTIYSGVKQLVHAFSLQDKISFKKVIVTEFPRKGVYSIGFVTNELAPEICPTATQKCYTVFIPTTPNPTSGFFVILTEAEMQTIDVTRQEAMAMIISGGIIQPERLAKKE